MNNELRIRLLEVLERPHRLGMIGGDLEEQLAHCASFSRVLAETLDGAGPWHDPVPPQAFDLGAGGGVPGVPLAVAHPLLTWTLVEIRTGRARELERALMRMGSPASVVTEPAQDLAHARREQASIVVARAFGPPALTAECASGLLVHGGALIVSEPPTSAVDRWPTESLADLGFAPPIYREEATHRFVVLVKTSATPPEVPRRPARSDRGWYRHHDD